MIINHMIFIDKAKQIRSQFLTCQEILTINLNKIISKKWYSEKKRYGRAFWKVDSKHYFGMYAYQVFLCFVSDVFIL